MRCPEIFSGNAKIKKAVPSKPDTAFIMQYSLESSANNFRN